VHCDFGGKFWRPIINAAGEIIGSGQQARFSKHPDQTGRMINGAGAGGRESTKNLI
jgi:hypothetical protein